MAHEPSKVVVQQRPPKTTGTYIRCSCGTRSMVFPGVGRAVEPPLDRWYMRHLSA